MKKLLILVFVLAFVSTASANTAGFEIIASDAASLGVDGGSGAASYAPGTTLTLALKASFDVTNVSLGAGATAGTAVAVGTLNGTLSLFANNGALQNSGGVLISGIIGGVPFGSGAFVPATNALYTFDFLVPEVAGSTVITIDNTAAFTKVNNGTAVVVDALDDLLVHVGVPEPMTIALLGLGGLFLRRRK